LGIAPQSAEAQNFALATLYLHWTFVPYSIYCVASILFAYAHYNLKLPFSLGSMLAPLLGTSRATRVGPVVDAVCLYSLVAGMAATLGTGILTISGGLESLWKIPRSGFVWGLITTAIVATFIASSATGLMRGIRILSDINTKGLLLLGLLVFLLGPTWLIIQHGCWAAVQYPWALWRTGLWEPVIGQDAWARQWSVFYWAVWMAWTPITACFLGRIAYGRTIHEFLLVNLLAPSLFCMVWMSVWATTTLHFEQAGAGLEAGRQIAGNESVSYAVLAALPGGTVMVTFYLLSAFVCFVTSADSNTTAMASISSRDVSLANPEGPTWVKIAWGILVGATAWIMVSFADVEGIRTLSNLGGFPAACLLVFVLLSLLKVSLSQSATDPEHPSPQGFAAAESRPPT
jgi:choline-glycine betaine transporter